MAVRRQLDALIFIGTREFTPYYMTAQKNQPEGICIHVCIQSYICIHTNSHFTHTVSRPAVWDVPLWHRDKVWAAGCAYSWHDDTMTWWRWLTCVLQRRFNKSTRWDLWNSLPAVLVLIQRFSWDVWDHWPGLFILVVEKTSSNWW